MCYPVCRMVPIKPLLLIEKSSPCGSSGFPLSLFVVLYYRVAYVVAAVFPLLLFELNPVSDVKRELPSDWNGNIG